MARKKDPKYKKIDLINKIVEMTCSGKSQPEVINWLKTEAECQISYIYECLREAKPIIIDTLKDLSKDRLEMTIAELEEMKADAKRAHDKKLVLEIQKEINKIAGLHNQKQELDITSGGDKITEIKLIEIVRKGDEDEPIDD